MSMTSKQRAEKAAAAMWADDAASQWAGMRIDAVDEGSATLSLEVAPHHCNGHGTCHGGVTFMLADSAFAFACNSRNQSTVGMHSVISYLAPGRLGSRLTATAREVTQQGRNGIYDVRVTAEDGTLIAEFRGMSRAINGTLFDEEDIS